MSIKKTLEAASIESAATSDSEKEAIASRVDRKQAIRSVFEYAGPMSFDSSAIGAGFQPQWAHDENDTIGKYLRLGYTYAEDRNGEKISAVVFKHGERRGLKAFLMKAPDDVMKEINEVRSEINERDVRELQNAKDPNFPTLGLKQTNT